MKSQLIQAEQTGYNPSADHATYPVQIQAVDAKIAAQNDQSNYGGVADTLSASGSDHAPAHTGTAIGLEPVYLGY